MALELEPGVVPIVIDSRLRVPLERLPDAVRDELEAEFTHENPKRKSLEYMGIPAWSEPKEFITWGLCMLEGALERSRARWRPLKKFTPGAWVTFPRGGLTQLRDALSKALLAWEYVDHRALGSDKLLGAHGQFPDLQVTMRPYQDAAIEVMWSKQNALVRGSTGSGKTESCFGLIAKVGRPALVVVHNVVLFEQWIARAKKVFGLSEKAIGRVRGKVRKLGLVTVAMQKTLAEMDEAELDALLGSFGVVIVDECQLAAARTLFRIVDRCPAKWRIGVSDSERRKDRLDVLIHNLLGESQHEISREEMIAGGYVLEVEVRVLPTDFEAPWFGLDDGTGDKEVDFNRLLDEMRRDEARNLIAVEHAARAALDERPTIVMSHRRDHALLLEAEISARGARTGLVIGGDDYAAAFRDTISKFRKGKIRCAVGTVQAVGTGLDLPLAEVGMVTTPITGNKQLSRQVWGRFCRNAEGKEGAVLYVLWDRHVYPRHLANMLAWWPVVRVWNGKEYEDGRAYSRAQRALGGI